jgi:EAL domain-containing protein (putative c-di-GMP-specific phosphodiesterase class I)
VSRVYLRSFQFYKIKINQSFVRDLVKTQRVHVVVRAVTGLSMKTMDEGVETQEQLDRLRAERCTEPPQAGERLACACFVV